MRRLELEIGNCFFEEGILYEVTSIDFSKSLVTAKQMINELNERVFNLNDNFKKLIGLNKILKITNQFKIEIQDKECLVNINLPHKGLLKCDNPKAVSILKYELCNNKELREKVVKKIMSSNTNIVELLKVTDVNVENSIHPYCAICAVCNDLNNSRVSNIDICFVKRAI